MVRSAAKNFEDAAIVTRVVRLSRTHLKNSTANHGSPEPRNALAAGEAGLVAHRRLRQRHRQHAGQDRRSPCALKLLRSRTTRSLPSTICIKHAPPPNRSATEKTRISAPRSTLRTGLGVAGATQLQGKERKLQQPRRSRRLLGAGEGIRSNPPSSSSSTPTRAARPPEQACLKPTPRH